MFSYDKQRMWPGISVREDLHFKTQLFYISVNVIPEIKLQQLHAREQVMETHLVL